jgi:hypothetical protein
LTSGFHLYFVSQAGVFKGVLAYSGEAIAFWTPPFAKLRPRDEPEASRIFFDSAIFQL